MASNSQELISILKAQHRNLQNDLKLVSDELKSEATLDSSSVVKKLSKFKIDILEHIKLENGEFYPDYLAKKEAKGENTAKAKEFIKVMEDIGKVIMTFLDKYSRVETIKGSRLVLTEELHNIIGTLNTRIETEEEGVFDIYLIS